MNFKIGDIVVSKANIHREGRIVDIRDTGLFVPEIDVLWKDENHIFTLKWGGSGLILKSKVNYEF